MTTIAATPHRAAQAMALSLAEGAGAGILAQGAGRAGSEGRLLASLLGHELAAGHCLMMRLAGQANAFLDRAGPGSPDGAGERAGQEAVRLVGGVARMMERYRLGVLALAKLRNQGKDVKVIEKVVEVRWGEEGDEENKGLDPFFRGGGGGTGSGGGGSGGGSGGGPGSGPGPFNGSGSGPGAAPRSGQLRHGNPSGDLSAVRRCGACTRAGTACRQPAMANGRCRFHGGRSTGPRTPAGLARSRSARYLHGARSRPLLALRSQAAHSARRLAHLTRLSRGLLAGHGVDGPDPSPPLPQSSSRRPRTRSGAGPVSRSTLTMDPLRGALRRLPESTPEPSFPSRWVPTSIATTIRTESTEPPSV